jgi:predicted nuclease of restriction endonuclease-like (RecB) superfamily
MKCSIFKGLGFWILVDGWLMADIKRHILAAKLSPVARELHPNIVNTFKDSYVLEFLGLPPVHSENDLQKALIQHMKQFILELGKDFIFMGEEFRLQVGNQDFYIEVSYECA